MILHHIFDNLKWPSGGITVNQIRLRCTDKRWTLQTTGWKDRSGNRKKNRHKSYSRKRMKNESNRQRDLEKTVEEHAWLETAYSLGLEDIPIILTGKHARRQGVPHVAQYVEMLNNILSYVFL